MQQFENEPHRHVRLTLTEPARAGGRDEQPSSTSSAMDRAVAESQAWQRLTERIEQTFDINLSSGEYELVISAIEVWGEELVALRSTQNPYVVKSARMQAFTRDEAATRR